VNRLLPRSRSIPWAMHMKPTMNVTGLEAKIVPTILRTSSMNLKTMYTITAGIRNIARYTHVEAIPKTVSGRPTKK